MIDLNEDELKKKLSPEQYHVLREKGTEQAFSGKLLNEKGTGDFLCGVCGHVVFKSDTKFESGTGWPSFYDAANNEAITLTEDNSVGMIRTEVACANCGSHLGHLFHDAYDQPTGNRFCINSAALDFSAKK